MGVMAKPDVINRLHQYMRAVRKNNNQVGTIPRTITIDYNNVCNFRCSFCYESGDHVHSKIEMSLEDISDIADQAYALGFWEIILQGGELLINKAKLFKLIEAIKPERFRVILISNGFLLTKEYAEELASIGLDCIGVSITGMDAELFDSERRVKGAHERALNALHIARDAGLTTWIQPIFGHHNAKSQDLKDLLEYAKDNDFNVYFMLAMPYGVWKDNYMNAEDRQIFSEIRKAYKSFFDTWDFFDPKKERISGCWSMNRIFVTPLGDVLPCPFINITVGNLKSQSLKSIMDTGFSIKHFANYSPVCLAAEDKAFRDKYLSGSQSMFAPAKYQDVFTEDDFI